MPLISFPWPFPGDTEKIVTIYLWINKSPRHLTAVIFPAPQTQNLVYYYRWVSRLPLRKSLPESVQSLNVLVILGMPLV
jgi:hypothetical protein